MITGHIRNLRPAATAAACGLILMLVIGCGSNSRQPSASGTAASDSSFPAVRVISLDEDGKLRAPGQLQVFAKEVKDTGVTDVFLMAHGWNNSSTDALASYQQRSKTTHELFQMNPTLRPNGYKPMVIGLIWPSKAWDYGPVLESAGPTVSLTPDQIAALEESFPVSAAMSALDRAEDMKTITQLAQKKKADTTQEDRQKAFALFRKYSINSTKLKYPTHDDQSRFEGPVPEGTSSLPEGAFPSIADAARVFTFWQMKKRAGIVGENGGAAVLKALTEAAPACRIHLFGHSFGTKVVLSSVLAFSKDGKGAKVDTLVLVQGAISYQSFADQVSGAPPSTPGGYREVLKAVKGPIVATFSKFDRPLNHAYPVGAQIGGQTGATESPASPYSALGALGFDNVNPIIMKTPGAAYGFLNEPKLYSIASSDHIPGHSEISNPAVSWLEWAAIVRH